jgi:hypothetical protein
LVSVGEITSLLEDGTFEIEKLRVNAIPEIIQSED